MSDIYFFTDVDLLEEQTAEQAFGPVSRCEETQYRVTSMHTATVNPCAYAVCDGIIKIQDSDLNPDNLVNIILKPSSHQKINGVEIKYFIYRGILKESIVNMSKVDELALNDVYNIDMLTTIWQNQDVYEQNVENNIPCSKILYGEQPYYATISDLFEEDKQNYCDYVCKAGESIGVFFKDTIGFEVVLNKMLTDDTIVMAKSLEHIINVEDTEGYSNEEIRVKREQILCYIDPISFYGSIDIVKNSKNLIHECFYNSSVIYVNFMLDNGVSLFYENYMIDCQINVMLSINQLDIEKNLSYTIWPIIRLNLNDIILSLSVDTITLKNIVINTTEKFPIYNNYKVFYKDNFIISLYRNNTLVLDGKGKNPNFINYLVTDFILSTYIEIVFCSPNGTTSRFIKTHYIDNLFPLNKLPNITKDTVIKTLAYKLYVDSKHKIFNPIIDNDYFNGLYDSHMKMTKDRVFFFAISSNSKINDELFCDDFFDGILETFNYVEPIVVSSKYNNENERCFYSIRKNVYKNRNISLVRYSDFIAISIKRTEYDELCRLVTSSALNFEFPIFLQAQDDIIVNDYDDSTLKYEKVNLQICGLNKNNTITKIPTNISVYSVDGIIFSSSIERTECVDHSIVAIKDYFNEPPMVTCTFNDKLLNNTNIYPIVEKFVRLNVFLTFVSYLKRISKYPFNINFELYDNFTGFNHPGANGMALFINMNNSVIYLNSYKLVDKKDDFIIKTCMHELLHVYLQKILYTKQKNAYPGVQDFYHRYKPNDDGDKYMSAQHNHMAYAYRNVIIKAMKEYNMLIGDIEREGTVAYKNIFTKENLIETYTPEEYYNALSWSGLVKYGEDKATMQWRILASKNKKQYLKLLAILNRDNFDDVTCEIFKI
jgi:hypothetical protein